MKWPRNQRVISLETQKGITSQINKINGQTRTPDIPEMGLGASEE
jgi:hypothetical protein